MTLQLRLLQAHGLLRKVSGTHRYVVSEGGRKIITALLAARQAEVEQLTALAALENLLRKERSHEIALQRSQPAISPLRLRGFASKPRYKPRADL